MHVRIPNTNHDELVGIEVTVLLNFNPTTIQKISQKNRPRCNDGKALAKVSQDEVASFAAGMALAQRWRV